MEVLSSARHAACGGSCRHTVQLTHWSLNAGPSIRPRSLTAVVPDGRQSHAVLQQLLFGPMVHGGADGQHGARLLLLQRAEVWRRTEGQTIKINIQLNWIK